MSRLIAADAFDKCLENAEAEAISMRKYVFASAVNVIRGNLRSFQTIEERKKGRWTDDNACQFCSFQPWYERDIHTLSYCPNCGADMRGEANDETAH